MTAAMVETKKNAPKSTPSAALAGAHSTASAAEGASATGGVVLERWAKTELARHPQRPDPVFFLEQMFADFAEIHGDRSFGDDPAIRCGFARFRGAEVMVIANVKGRTTKEKVAHRFGMPDPEGYRKALRAMKLAEKFHRPVITLIDLMGANPGLGAEERGQAEAIARNLREMSRLRVPTIAVITGEGGSGGALALAVTDRVLMLEKSIYSVISPEACASIMWRDASKRAQAAEALRATAPDALALGCIDEIVAEPQGGAHEQPEEAAALLADKIAENLQALEALGTDALLAARYTKFRNMAQFYEG
ncbi:acetyl-CoA carboxylase carboxyltransferase subunit alpha [Acidipila sp. EB88]|uniref:acetyl-CoA carboxylase carboxyltransferase subunit alpha n=1 Tax=Acidipila sp. EB88 TaxID=2305226 RepID=UPI000F5F8078|nr:acetyl-CoA carboxylase carboxyltransferase subunit alpha [Acidipila sp. EB88]RRA50251.1 acetyl-CoA carboxylase carboxyltransferase subunit alpha [Acidipila sp. EB88]